MCLSSLQDFGFCHVTQLQFGACDEQRWKHPCLPSFLWAGRRPAVCPASRFWSETEFTVVEWTSSELAALDREYMTYVLVHAGKRGTSAPALSGGPCAGGTTVLSAQASDSPAGLVLCGKQLIALKYSLDHAPAQYPIHFSAYSGSSKRPWS
jgi:hypothetical protein